MRAEARELPPGVSPSAVAALYARYEDEKAAEAWSTSTTSWPRCAEAMEADPTFAGAQRWRWRHLFVDEFQDLNPLQHRLLLAWLGVSTDLCVVGDPDQAIYGWNGADPELLAQVPTRWPSHRGRSTSTTITAASPRSWPPPPPCSDRDGAHLRSAGPDGPAPDVRAYPSRGGGGARDRRRAPTGPGAGRTMEHRWRC